MSDFLLQCLVFLCGGFLGFIAAVFFSASRADEPDEFDGGFRASNAPPARTVIWGGRVEDHRE